MDGRVTTWYWVSDRACNLIQWNIINAEPPHKLLDRGDVLLMGLWREKCLEKPLAIMDLADVIQFRQISDALSHDRYLPGAVVDLLDGDRLC